jgi:hypothetical protein
MSGEWLSDRGREGDSETVGRAGLSTTRRDVLAASALAVTTATAGCISSRGSARGIAWIRLYNPTTQSRTVHVTVVGSDQTILDTRATVPPRASLGLADDVLMEQTVEVRVEHDGLSTVYQWDVQTSLDVILGPDTRFQTERETREPRELPGSGRVDVRLGGKPRVTGGVRVVRGDETVFEAERTFSVASFVTYHDCLDAAGEVMITVQRADSRVSESLSLAGAGQVAADASRLFVDVYEPPTEE